MPSERDTAGTQHGAETLTVRTAAVGSVVFDEDREVAGHVALVDLDGASESDAIGVATEVDGPAAVVRSSADSWHVWGLSVRSWSDALDAIREHSEPEHVDAAERRGEAHARTVPKFDDDSDEIVASAPEPVAVVDGLTDAPVSAPHLTVLQQLADQADVSDRVRWLFDRPAQRGDAVGSTLSTARYSYEVSR